MATIQDLWGRVPHVQCKGLCSQACGPIGCSQGEARLMAEAGGKPLTFSRELTCGYLKDGRCTVYDVRPLACRYFGVVKHELMRCPHGCRPARWLEQHEADALMRQMRTVGGDPAFADPELT